MHSELIFYDYEFNVLGRTLKASELYAKELYNGIGSFEAEIDISEHMAGVLLGRDYTVLAWDDLYAIVTSVQTTANGRSLKIYGRTPNWMLSKRACPNFGHRTGTPHMLAHGLVEEVWGDSIVTGIGSDIGNDVTTFWRNVYNPLSEVVSDCLDRADGGHRVVFDVEARQWRFETYEGRERETVFSADRRNATDIGFAHSVLDCFNGGFYTTDEDSGNWTEIPSDKEGIYKWTARLTSSGADSAANELKRRRVENKLDFCAVNVVRGRDYDLGDIVRVANDLGEHRFASKMRVRAVERWADSSGYGERPLLENI